MKNVMLLTDFSEDAKHAIYYGLKLFGDEDMKYTLIHGMFLRYANTGALASAVDVRTELARNSFATLLAEIRQDFPDKHFDIEIEIRCGEIESVVTHMEKTRPADLIIMGTRGAGGLADVLMGTSTVAIMEQVSTPVLAVPASFDFQDPAKIVLAMDNGEGPPPSVLQPMVKIAERFDAQVLVIHVAKEENSQQINHDKVNAVLSNVRSHCVTIHDEDVSNGLGRYVKSEKVQMLSMIKQKLNFFERVFHRSLSNKMVMQTDVPMLVMSHKA
ncbi:MAG: universal stress protein [Bacteroidota bacterium]